MFWNDTTPERVCSNIILIAYELQSTPQTWKDQACFIQMKLNIEPLVPNVGMHIICYHPYKKKWLH